ncbi:MAG: hypothetical protein MZV64_11315 [Ignavibacteriales bacterium]|nr:hypothetical protein [Ignavibacteriales bacterium]
MDGRRLEDVAQLAGVGQAARSRSGRRPRLRFMTMAPRAVALRVDAEHGAAVLEQDGRRMAQVLAGLAVDDDLPRRVRRQVHGRDREAARDFGRRHRFLGAGGGTDKDAPRGRADQQH